MTCAFDTFDTFDTHPRKDREMTTSTARTVAVSPWPWRRGGMPHACVDLLALVAARQDAVAARLNALEATPTDYQSVPASRQPADLQGRGTVPHLSPSVEGLSTTGGRRG